MPRYLALETSSPRLSLALGDNHRVLATHESALAWRHAEILFIELRKLLNRVKWRITDLNGVVVCVGPGSFTGIRIGLAVARTLGQTLRIPVVGITSLEAIAVQAPPQFKWLCPRLDGLQGKIFTGLFKRAPTGVIAIEPGIRTEETSWLAKVRKKVGSTAIWVSSTDAEKPRAATLLRIAPSRLAKAGRTSYRRVLPFYIRDASAVERLHA